jgi:hypothetical protein
MKKYTKVIIFVLFLLVLTPFLGAQAEDTGAQFTSFAGFDLHTIKLTGVQNTLGPAKLVETGDAGEYTASVCYSVPGGVILFLSGELDGPDHNLGGFGLAKETDRLPCSKWPTGKQIPNLSIGGLHLGMSVSEFTQRVGAAVRMVGQIAYADFESKRKLSQAEIQRLPEEVQKMIKTGEEQDYYDVMVSVIATFNNGQLNELRVWKTETL